MTYILTVCLAWVHAVEEEDHEDPTSLLLPRTPTSARPASHNFMPTPKPNAVPGRHFDHAREGTPVTITSPMSEQASNWRQFASVSRPSTSRGRIVDDSWMKENMPDLETPWVPEDEPIAQDEAGFWLLDSNRRRRRVKRIQVSA